MVFHVGNNWTHSFLLRKSECFKHVLWRIQVSRWYVLRTTQNGDFVLLPLCVALCWRSGALSAQWRSVGTLAPERVVPSLVSPCAHARFCWMFLLTHATALKPSHSNKSYPLHHVQHKMRSHSLTNFTVNRNHVATVISQKEICRCTPTSLPFGDRRKLPKFTIRNAFTTGCSMVPSISCSF